MCGCELVCVHVLASIYLCARAETLGHPLFLVGVPDDITVVFPLACDIISRTDKLRL